MLAYATDKKSRIPPKSQHHSVSSSWHAQHPRIQQILRRPSLQPKLTVGAPNDKYEQEADRVADQVMRMPESGSLSANGGPSPLNGTIQRTCASCSEEYKTAENQNRPVESASLCPGCQGNDDALIQTKQLTPHFQRQELGEEEDELLQTKKAGGSSPEVTPAISAGIRSLQGGGRPMSGSERSFFEPRFGADFSGVRVHSDMRAASLARSVNARAFTLGRNVVFGSGEYSSDVLSGKKLLAHELTHVVQQGAALSNNLARPVVARTARDNQLQGAWFKVGNIRVNADYGDVIRTPVGDFVSKIESMYIRWTGAANANNINASLTALTVHKQRWVMLGLDLLMDNTKSFKHNALDRKAAVKHLIARAPNTKTSIASPRPDMEKEVLQVSGWLEVALAAPLKKPKGKKLADVTKEFYPPTSGGSTKTSVSHLDKAILKARLPPALKHYIKKIDPRGSSSVGTRSLPTLKSLGDTILGEAKSYFTPYSDSARSSVFSPVHSSFKISANIESTTSGINKDLRRAYLSNRGQTVGNRRDAKNSYYIDKDIFFDAGYNHSVTSDKNEFLKIIVDIGKDATIKLIVDALLAFTGRQEGGVENAKIWLPLTYRKSRYPTECKARWRVIDTLSHEVLHALSHPNFSKQKVGMGQIIEEGFAEALGVQLYNNRIVPKAKREPAFKKTMEAGLSSAPCSNLKAATIDYKPAGPAAERIRDEVKDNNFRAAYFLGAMEKVGL